MKGERKAHLLGHQKNEGYVVLGYNITFIVSCGMLAPDAYARTKFKHVLCIFLSRA
jgi:hypothetical protein